MKTYHMYHAESISAESKLKEAEKQEEKQIGRSGDPVFHLRLEERHQRRSSVKKIEKMKEKVGLKLHRRALAPHMGRRDSRKDPDPTAIVTHLKTGISSHGSDDCLRHIKLCHNSWTSFRGERPVIGTNLENWNIDRDGSVKVGPEPKSIVVIPRAGELQFVSEIPFEMHFLQRTWGSFLYVE